MTKVSEAQKNEKDFLDTFFFYVGLLLGYKKIIIITTTVAAIGILIFSILTLKLPANINPMPNIYRSTAAIRFESRTSTISLESLLSSIGAGSSADPRGRSTDSAVVVEYLLESGAFLDKLVEEFDLITELGITEQLKTHSRRFVNMNSNIMYDRSSGIMYISFDSTDPAFARDFVNRKVELLQEWFLNEGGSARSRELQLLKRRMEEIEAQISSMEEEVQIFQGKYGVLSVDALADQITDIYSDLQSQLVNVDMEIRQYSQYSRVEDPALSRLRAEKQNILSMMEQLDNGYTISGRSLPSRNELSELSIEFSRIAMSLQIQKDIYQTLAQRYEVLRLAESESDVFSVLEWGEIPEEKLGPQRGIICIQVTLAAFFGTIILILGFHFLKKIIYDPNKTKLLKYPQG